MQDNADFYDRLPVFETFASIMDPVRYQPLPDDWLIGLTDVVNSTQAIASGRYKAVNTAGAAVISAIGNALPGRKFPFVFGGDGASFAVPACDQATASSALAATAAWTRDDLDLTLRAALVPVAAINATNGIIVSLLVIPVTHGDPAFRGVVESLLTELEDSPEAARPVPDNAPGVSWPPAGAELETRTSRVRGESLLLWRVRVLFRTLLSYTVMRTGMRVGAFDPAVYRREVVENSDFRKYDDNLRMTLDCTPALADRIEQQLAKAARANIVRFGIHRQPAAIMTCIVPSITESNHVHFIDGAAGGYAVAAQSMRVSG